MKTLLSLTCLAALSLGLLSPLHAGLVAYWPFNDAATLGNDTAGGTVLATGGGTLAAAGKFGGGLALNGTSQYLGGTVNNLPIGNSTYSQVAWFKPTAVGNRGLVGWGNFGTARQCNALRLLDTGAGTNAFRHYWWGADLDSVSSTTVNFLDGNWHHAATTFDGTNRRVYLDGVQVSTDAPGVNAATAVNFRIGSTNNGEFFSGTLDDVAIFNHALTPTQVASLAAGGSPVAGPSITSFTANKTTAYEGETVALSWTVSTASVTGIYSYEIKNGATTLSSGSATTGTFSTTIPDLTATAQTVTYTLRAIETGGGNVTNTATVSVAADPGIPAANTQAGLTTPANTPLSITLVGSDPNAQPLSYIIVTSPAQGTLSGPGANKTYTPTANVYGSDQFTFKVNDGKYDSGLATVRLTVLTPPVAPTVVLLDDSTIRPEHVPGDFLSTLSCVDANAAEAHTFSLIAGVGATENGNFTIVGHQLRAAVAFASLVGVPQHIRVRGTDSGGLFVETALVLSVVAKAKHLVINEVHYNGGNSVVRNSFVEIYNDTAASVNLTNWHFTGALDYIFPSGTTIAAGAYLVVAEDPTTILSYFGKPALGPWLNAIITYPDGSKESNNLPNSGGNIKLRDAANSIISEVDYNNHTPWPSEGDGGNSSIELRNPSLDETHGSNWAPAKPAGVVPDYFYISAATSGWKYFKGTTAPSTTWKNPTGADLTGWLDGTTTVGNATVPYFGFGYADSDDVPTADFSDMRQTTVAPLQTGYQAVYFRKEFTILPGQIPASLNLRVYVDDGCIVYLNGVEIPVRFYCGTGTPAQAVGATVITGVSWANHEAAPNNWDSYALTNLAAYNLVEGTNVFAILAANDVKTSSDFSFNLEVKKGTSTLDIATPGSRNINYVALASNAPPAVRNVTHTPQSPTSSDPIVVTTKVTDPNGVASVALAYQIMTPGNFIPSTLPKAVSAGNFVNVATPLAANPAFELAANWTTVAMNDDGLGDDALGGDNTFTATIPPQVNRTMIRYRITVTDNFGNSARVPYPGDASLNYAAYIYNGVPDYEGTTATDLQKLPVYQFITRKVDYDQCVAYDAAQRVVAGTSWNFENWEGAFVYDGVVYDHLPYRLKGANGRYVASGTGGAGNAKRAFKVYFNKGYELQARDQAGNNYPTTWNTLVTENLWENRASYCFSLNEAVDFYLFNQLGVPAPYANFAHFRTVMQAGEQPDKWHGDFWGLMWVHEDYDHRFLQAHNLKKGNLYKLTRDGVTGTVQSRYQGSFAPVDGSDHDDLYTNLKGTSLPAYITGRVDLDRWCRLAAFNEAIRNYDYWPNGDNNAAWYFYPNYNAGNGNKGQMWYLPNDVDATWGPTWNNGHDIVHNALFNDFISGSNDGGDTGTNPTLWPQYFNQVHEIRSLLWQPDQINPLIDQFAAVIRPIVNAEFKRWVGSPADAGNFDGLFGPNNTALNAVGSTALDLYIAGMKDFAFDANNNGGVWPGADVGVGGRAAFMDTLGGSLGENNTVYPNPPTITFAGGSGYPVNDLRFASSAFSDPQGAGTFAAQQWRMAQVNTSGTYVATEPRLLEINASHDSGEKVTLATEYKFPATACEPGKRYRARVRMKDNTGRWSFWSAPVEFTAGTFDPTAYASQIVVSEIMYHATTVTNAERAVASAQVPGQTWNDDAFDYVELRNVSASALDLTGFQFTAGFNFAFPSGTTLAPGAVTLVVANLVAFNTRYGTGKPIAGVWSSTDKLSNGGETLTLSFGLATPPIISFAYNDNPALNWPTTPDGFGASLAKISPEDLSRDPALGINWRASNPSPGVDDRVSYPSWLGAMPAGDGNHDGLDTLVEYALGGSATADNSALIPTAAFQPYTVAAATSTYATLTFQRSILNDICTQHVEFSTNLNTWPILGVQVMSTDNGNGTRREVWRSSQPVETNTRIFGRVRFTLP